MEVGYCRCFQALLKVGNYFMGYRMPQYLEGPGKIRELGAFLQEKNIHDVLVVTGSGMVRRGHGETLLALCNFGSDSAVYDGPLGDAPSLLLHTDLVEFGGDTEEGELNTELPLLLPPYSGMLLRIE